MPGDARQSANIFHDAGERAGEFLHLPDAQNSRRDASSVADSRPSSATLESRRVVSPAASNRHGRLPSFDERRGTLEGCAFVRRVPRQRR